MAVPSTLTIRAIPFSLPGAQFVEPVLLVIKSGVSCVFDTWTLDTEEIQPVGVCVVETV